MIGPTVYFCPAAACLSAHSLDISGHQTETHLYMMSSQLTAFDYDCRHVGINNNTLIYEISSRRDLDDDGTKHEWSIPRSHGKICLLSLQHWAQHMLKRAPACIGTHAHPLIVNWQTDCLHHITRTIDPHTDVASLYLATGHTSYSTFVQCIDLEGGWY